MRFKLLTYITLLLAIPALAAKENTNQKTQPQPEAAKNTPIQKTISIDSGYLPYFNSTRAISDFDFELRQGWGALYDVYYKKLLPTTTFGRALFYGLFNFATWGPQMTQMATLHEFGHASRLASIGIDSSFINVGKLALKVYSNGTKDISLSDLMSDNYFSTLFGNMAINVILPILWTTSGVMPRPDKALLFTPQNKEQFYNPKTLEFLGKNMKPWFKNQKYGQQKSDVIGPQEFENLYVPETAVLFNAGGLNLQQDQCRKIENAIWFSEGNHLTTMNTYFWDKIWAGFQSSIALTAPNPQEDGNDTSRIIRAYKKMGIQLSHEEINRYALLSYLLSTQTYANIYQIYTTIAYGENQVYAPEYKNFKLPNVAFYFTTKGPTYNIGSGYKVNQAIYIPFSVEFGLKDFFGELKIGFRKKFFDYKDAFIHADLILNPHGIGGGVYGEMGISQHFRLQGGATLHNAHTLEGERNIPSYKNGMYDLELWVKFGLQY